MSANSQRTQLHPDDLLEELALTAVPGGHGAQLHRPHLRKHGTRTVEGLINILAGIREPTRYTGGVI